MHRTRRERCGRGSWVQNVAVVAAVCQAFFAPTTACTALFYAPLSACRGMRHVFKGRYLHQLAVTHVH